MMAIAVDDGYAAPSPTLGTRRSRHRLNRRNHGRFISKLVRRRNARLERPRWQPTHSFKKLKLPRAAQLAAALKEEFDETALAPDEFWAKPATDVAEYEQDRISQDAVEIEARQAEILDGIERESCEKALRLRVEAERLGRLEQLLSWQLAAVSHEEYRELATHLKRIRLELEVVRLELDHYELYAELAA